MGSFARGISVLLTTPIFFARAKAGNRQTLEHMSSLLTYGPACSGQTAQTRKGNAKLARQSSPRAGRQEPKPEPLTKPLENTETIDFDIIELLFFSYRDFVSDPDAILAKSGFGRAHHRVVHFVNRNPGMTVADLLDTLKITKQSLARVLKQLIDSGYIQQKAGPEDRRQRKLYPTATGRDLALALAEPQSRRIERAFDGASPEVRAGVKAFLSGMQNRQNSKAD